MAFVNVKRRTRAKRGGTFGLTVLFESKIKELNDKRKSADFRNLGQAAATIRLTARRSLRVRRNPSPPGRPPHSGTRVLRDSIIYDVDRRNRDAVYIGPSFRTANIVGSVHEFGKRYKGDRYPARPFMRPALEKNVNRIPRIWGNSIS